MSHPEGLAPAPLSPRGTEPSRHEVREGQPSGSGKRSDIQGLRAAAVLLVVAEHLFGRPVGGFVGVDVFFVISGFLITDLLLREHGRHGRISFTDFYRRRARRILPVAVVVLVSTVAATYAIYGGNRADSVLTDAGWAAVFLANWHFADVGTNYFLNFGPVSPLQHYWSLAVEEQFYVIWPALLLVLLGIGRRTRSPRGIAGVGALGLVAALLGYSLVHTRNEPVVAYFSSVDRAWELGAGALLALSIPALVRTPRVVAALLSWTGLAGIAVAALVIDPDVAFPAPWALLPVLSTSAVIAGGAAATASTPFILRLRPVQYVGDISYSLYLWHFPVVILMPALLTGDGWLVTLSSVVVMAGLSVASFHLVEDPIRRSNWLEPRWRRRSGPVNHSHRVANAWIAVGALVLVPVVSAALAVGSRPQAEPLLGARPPGKAGVKGARGEGQTAAAYLARRIDQSLGLEEFPQLEPPPDELGGAAWLASITREGCVSVDSSNVGDCRYGAESATRTLLVLGDSFAIAWMPAIKEAFGATYRIQQVTLPECPPWDVVTTRFGSDAPFPECPAHRSFAQGVVASSRPDLLIVASSWGAVTALASDAQGTAAVEELAQGATRTLDRLVPEAGATVVLSGPPGAPDLQSCGSRLASPEDCEGSISQTWSAVFDAEDRAAAQAGATHVDTRGWFCADSRCPGFVGTTPVYADGTHLTVEYARQLGDVLREAVRPAINR